MPPRLKNTVRMSSGGLQPRRPLRALNDTPDELKQEAGGEVREVIQVNMGSAGATVQVCAGCGAAEHVDYHPQTTCDGCNMAPITGWLVHCDTCGADLCSQDQCVDGHHRDHALQLIRRPPFRAADGH